MKKFFYSQKLAPYVFILPFVLTVIFFWAVPIANGVLLSFQDVLQDKWVGLDNYKRLLSDKIFLKALFNSTRYDWNARTSDPVSDVIRNTSE